MIRSCLIRLAENVHLLSDGDLAEAVSEIERGLRLLAKEKPSEGESPQEIRDRNILRSDLRCTYLIARCEIESRTGIAHSSETFALFGSEH